MQGHALSAAATPDGKHGANAETPVCYPALSPRDPVAVFVRRRPGWRMELHDSLCAARAAGHQRALRDLLAAGFSGALRCG